MGIDRSDAQNRFNRDAHVNVMLYPEEFVNLAREVQHPFHKPLQDQLAIDQLFPEMASFATHLAAIATYVGVLVHGDYGADEITKLCTTLTKKLRQKRGMIDDIGNDLIIVES